MTEHLGVPDPNTAEPVDGPDVEQDYLQAFRVWVPTPGGENIMSQAAGMGISDGAYGSSLQLGAAISVTQSMVDASYCGFGVRTYGHIFLDGRGSGSANSQAADVHTGP